MIIKTSYQIFGAPKGASYIYGMMKKVKEIQLTQHEWNEAMRMPTPHRNKKKFHRKEKHKKGWRSEEQFVYLRRK